MHTLYYEFPFPPVGEVALRGPRWCRQAPHVVPARLPRVLVLLETSDTTLCFQLQVWGYQWSSVVNMTKIAKFMGQHGAHLGPVGPSCVPGWPHEPCYQGRYPMQSIPWSLMIWRHREIFVFVNRFRQCFHQFSIEIQHCLLYKMHLKFSAILFRPLIG